MSNLFTRLYRKMAAPWLKPAINPWDLLAGQGKSRPTDYASLIARYESWVYKCATCNANAVAAIPIRLYVRGKTSRFATRELKAKERRRLDSISSKAASADEVTEIIDHEHPLLQLLDGANPQMTGLAVRTFTALQLELIGNAYWYVLDGQFKIPSEIWPLLGQWVNVVPDRETFIAGYLYGKTSMDRVSFEPSEVIHFKYANPGDLFYGVGPLQAAVRAVDRGIAMGDYQQEFFDNSARVDFAIKVGEGTTREQRKELYQEWLDKFQGKGKRHLPLVTMGDMDISNISFPPSDTGILEGARFSREEIANVFGIPMTMLEISASRAEAEAQYWGYAVHTLTPRLRLMEETLNEQLVSRYDERLFVAFDDCVPDNEELEMKAQDMALRNWSTTINQVRAERGDEPVDYGDVPLNYNNGMPILTEPQAPTMFGRSFKALGTHEELARGEFAVNLRNWLDLQRMEVLANARREMGE